MAKRKAAAKRGAVTKSVQKEIKKQIEEVKAQMEKVKPFDVGDLVAPQRVYYEAAVDILKTYGGREAQDVLIQRTGASRKAAAWALDTARKNGAEVKTEPACAECGKIVKTWSALLQEGHCSEECYEKSKQRGDKPVPEGAEVSLEKLALGQHFSTETSDSVAARKGGWPIVSRTGFLAERGPGSVVVMLSATVKSSKAFTTASGKTVEFESSGKSRQRWALDTTVTALKEIEDLSLLREKSSVQFSSGQSDQGDDDMAKAAKKAAKKAEKGTRGRSVAFGDDSTVKLVKGPNADQIKRHVTILTCLKEAGKSMTLGALGKALAKASNTKQDGVKVVRMHLKALTDGGFISVTPAKA